MSANLIVDVANTALFGVSLSQATGVASPASGVQIGMPIDMEHANTNTQIWATLGANASGPCQVAVQTANVTTSGSFTDPTSGLAQMPDGLLSGGLLWVGSGGNPLSGTMTWGSFQRPHKYARLVCLSGSQTNAILTAGLLGQLRTTTSGGWYSYSPGSGGAPSV